MELILCDDDPFILKLTQEKLEEQKREQKIDLCVACATTEAQQVLQYLTRNPGEYLIFLDLDFGAGKLNGIDLARKIKQICDRCKVVFLTNHRDMAMQVLSSGVEPFGFLEKTTDLQSLSAGLLRYVRMAGQCFEPKKEAGEMVTLTVGIDEQIQIEKQQILYLEAEKSISHGITYHTQDGSSITVRDTMEQCSSDLGGDFLRIHRSFLVNRNYIVSLKGNQVCLSNGEELPCAVRMVKEVKRCLQCF